MRLLVLFIILVSHTATTSPYTFHIFASKWPGTFCLLNECWQNQTHHLRSDTFNIHGLWPSNHIQDQSPQYCDPQSKFLPNHYNTSLIEDLRSYWNPLDNYETSFHGHEWKKHGTCYQEMTPEKINNTDVEKQKRYFHTAIGLSKDFSLFEILKNAGINPSDWLQPLEKFTKAMNDKFGEDTFDLTCEKRKNKGQFLSGINVCLDLNLKPIACPYHVSDELKCDAEEIFFPAYKNQSEPAFLEKLESTDEIFAKFESLIYWGMAIWMPMIILIAIIIKRKFFGKNETERESQEVYLNFSL